jgi:undecaprenyl-diphosphatase
MKNEISFDMGFGNLAIGFIVSAVTGYFALKLLITVLRRNRLSVFACYCFVVGIITVASSAFGFLK